MFSISISISISISPSFSDRRLRKLHASSSSSSSSSSSFPASSASQWPQTLAPPSNEGSRPRRRIAGVDQEKLLDPWMIADADSRFAELHGVQIHHKIARASPSFAETTEADGAAAAVEEEEEEEGEGEAGEKGKRKEEAVCREGTRNAALPAVILLHGFGASLFSFERVLQPLSEVLGSSVLAFDRPAFGLTSRVKLPLEEVWSAACATADGAPINPYALGFSSSATIAFIDFLGSKEAVLISHSSGSIVAAEAYLKAPDRIAAMVLVAPSLFAPSMVIKKEQILDKQRQIKQILLIVWEKFLWAFNNILRAFQSVIKFIWRGIESCLKMSQRIALTVMTAIVSKEVEKLVKLGQQLWKVCLQVWKKIFWALNGIIAVLPPVVAFIRSQLFRLLTFTLRSGIGISLVRVIMDKLSLKAVQMAWFNKEKIDDYVIAGYTKPLKCRNWEYALIEYVIALLGHPSDVVNRLKDVRCPVLVITGDNDAVVPSWNAKRLTELFPNGRCHVIKDCGHLPQEEKPEDFVMIIERFIKQVLNAPHMAVVPMPI